MNKYCCEYPLIAAKKSKFIDKIFVSTDCPKIKKISKKYKVEFIDRPKKLANSKALGEDVFKYSYGQIKKKYKKKIEILVLLMANAPAVNKKMIDKGISILLKNKKFGNPKTLNCDRDSQGNVYFADMSVSVVRSYCIDKMKEGLLPQKWMGKKIAPIKSWGGGDIDYAFQIPQIEYWLKNNR